MSLWVNSCPAVFVSLCVNYPLYISPVFWVWFHLVYSLLPRCILSLSPALSYLYVFIKYYYLSLRPRLCVLVPPSCVHRDRRPDHNRKRRPFTLFCFPFCSSSRVAAPPGATFAGDRATGLPLTQCPPARLWLNAHRIAADSSPPDRRWLMPAGLPLTQAHRIGADSCPLAAAYPSPVESPHVTARSAVCLFCCAHRNILKNHVLSCPWRLVWGRRLLLLWPWRPF